MQENVQVFQNEKQRLKTLSNEYCMSPDFQLVLNMKIPFVLIVLKKPVTFRSSCDDSVMFRR